MRNHHCRPWALFTASLLLVAGVAAADTRYGAFVLETDRDNAHLPSSLELVDLPGVPLLHPELGLNLGYTTFEFRNKFYNEENRNIWARQRDPRFVVDVQSEMSGPDPVQVNGWVGQQVQYESSYGTITRTMLFDEQAPRMRIVYDITANRDIVIHMPGMFAVGLGLGEPFVKRYQLDARHPQGDMLTREAESMRVNRSLFPAGPVVVTDASGDLAVMITHEVSGDLGDPVPSRMIELAAGDQIQIAIHLDFYLSNPDGWASAMRTFYDTMDENARIYLLYETGHHLLYVQHDPELGEPIMHEVAALKPEWYVPFMSMAEYRLQNRIDGVVRGFSRGELYHEGAYRMPWNYGVILRGGDYLRDERLTDEQQRLLLLNMLAAMENSLFYPNYYVQPARAFEQRGMIAQACAMYRQALWAVENYPVREEIRERHRASFQREIERLEKILLEQITALPSEPVQVRPQ